MKKSLLVKLKALLTGHHSRIQDVAFSPSGELIAGAGEDGFIKFWDVLTEKETASFLAHEKGVNQLIFSQGGKLLASHDPAESVKLWDVTSHNLIYEMGATGGDLRIAFSPDVKYLAIMSENHGLTIWEVSSSQPFYSFTPPGLDKLSSIAYHPTGNMLAIGRDGGVIDLWDLANRKFIKTLAVPDTEGCDLKTKSLTTIANGHVEWVLSLAFDSSGKYLASGGADETVIIWDVQTGQDRHVLTGHSTYREPFTSYIRVVKFHPEAEILASGSRDKTVKLWDVLTGAEIASLGHSGEVASLDFNRSGNLLVTATSDRKIYLWEL